jgi:hypothetical protein
MMMMVIVEMVAEGQYPERQDEDIEPTIIWNYKFAVQQQQRGSTVVTEPGQGPAVAELAVRTQAAAADSGRVRTVAVVSCGTIVGEASAACDRGELGRMGRGPAAG